MKINEKALMKRVEIWDIEKILPYERNAKNHPQEQIDRLASTINRFGWDQPIVVDKNGVIIKGHGRRLAAIKLELKKVPVLVRDDMTPAEADAARIADNAVVGLSFDTRMMQSELQRLMSEAEVDFTIDELGLSSKDQDLLMSALNVADTSAIMEDTHAEIDQMQGEDIERIAKSDAEEVPIAEAFGFKRVTRQQCRRVANMITQLESDTGEKGIEALLRGFEAR